MSDYVAWPEDVFKYDIIRSEDRHGDLGSLWSAFRLGRKVGSGELLRYLFQDLPYDIQRLVEDQYQYSIEVSWFDAPPPGQSAVGKPNQYGIVIPRFWGYDDKKAHIILFTRGCDHDYRTHNERNCYREYTCKKCGYHVTHDSS